MALLVEKEVRAYQTKANTTICPVCASDEEKAKETPLVAEDVIHDPGLTVCPVCATDEEKATATEVVAEDVIHDPKPMYCVRCQKKIK